MARGDADPLQLSSAEFARVTVPAIRGQADAVQQPCHFFFFLPGAEAAMDVERLLQNPTDLSARVQGSEGVLEDDLHFPPQNPQFRSGHFPEVASAKKDLTRSRVPAGEELFGRLLIFHTRFPLPAPGSRLLRWRMKSHQRREPRIRQRSFSLHGNVF